MPQIIKAPALPLTNTKMYCWILPSNNSTNASGYHPKTLALLQPSTTHNLYGQNKFINIRNVAISSILGDHEERTQLSSYALDSTEPKYSNPDYFPSGRLVQDGLVYRENFLIRSFDVDCGKKLYVHALMNYLQEVAISHCRSIGLLACGFGTTPEMMKADLIWVVNSITIAIDRYPIWNDVVQIDSWKCCAGKNSLSVNWLVSDCKTGETLVRATSFNVLVNTKTRRFSRLTKEVREELDPFLMDSKSFIHHPKDIKIATVQHFDVDTSDTKVVGGIRPGCSDLDLNQHVSHIKYIDWVLQSTPRFIRDLYELSAMTLKYLKESNRDSVLQSVSNMVKNGSDQWDGDVVELDHSIILDCGAEAVRARTTWKRHAVTITPNSN